MGRPMGVEMKLLSSGSGAQQGASTHSSENPSKPPITVAWTSDVCILQQVSNAGRTEATPSTQTPCKAYRWGPAAGVQMEDQVYRKRWKIIRKFFKKYLQSANSMGLPFSKKKMQWSGETIFRKHASEGGSFFKHQGTSQYRPWDLRLGGEWR